MCLRGGDLRYTSDVENVVIQKPFTIETSTFTGPLDLLLTLIEKRKLLINDIALSKVADDYVTHVKTFEQFPVSLTAHFLLIASTLILIKSRSLLPSLSISTEEQADIEELENRLKTYQALQKHIPALAARLTRARMFGRTYKQIPARAAQFAPGKNVTVETLHGTLCALLQDLPQPEHMPLAAVKKIITLEEMLGRLRNRIRETFENSFHEFAGMQREERVHVVVSFLAMLELIKQGLITAKQREHFADITMQTQELQVPHYQ